MSKQACHCDSISLDKLKNMGVRKGYCGVCQLCGCPGHTRHYPSSVPYTGSWCDSCFIKLQRKEKIKIIGIVAMVVIAITLLISYQFFMK